MFDGMGTKNFEDSDARFKISGLWVLIKPHCRYIFINDEQTRSSLQTTQNSSSILPINPLKLKSETSSLHF